MRFTITRKILFIIAIPLLIQGAFVAALALSLADYANALNSSFRSRGIVAAANSVLRSMIDAETGIRGYIVTNDLEFTEPYESATQELPKQWERLRALVDDDPQQSARAVAVKSSADRALDWLRDTEQLAKSGRHDQATQRMKSREGKILMDDLRQLIEYLIAIENQKGDERTQSLNQSRRWMNETLFGGMTTLVVLTAASTLLFLRHIGKRFAVLTRNTERLGSGRELLAPLRGRDELAQLDQSFREMAEQLRQSSEQLQRSTREIQDLYNQAPCGYQSLDADGTIVAINDTELSWLNYKREEIIGRMNFADLLTEAGRRRFAENFPKFKASGFTSNVEYELVRKGGGLLPIALSATAVRDESGRFVRSRATLFDITERKRSEEELRKSTERFRQFVDTVTDYALVVIDPKGFVATWNAGAEHIIGYQPHEIIGKHFSRFYPSETVARGWPGQELEYAAARGRFEDEGWRLRKDGTPFWANVVITALRNQRDELEGYAKITRDLTERKRNEEEVRKLNEDLENRVRQRTADLVEANRELREKNQENEMFVYSVSHDLRTPLVNLQGFGKELEKCCAAFADLLADERLPADIRGRGQELLSGKMAKSLGFIQIATTRFSGIIDALLRLSRAGRVDYRWQQVQVDKIVANILGSMNGAIAEKKVAVVKRELTPIWGDPTAVEQVFANLIANALNYLDPNRPGTIEIGCETTIDNASSRKLTTYCVKDNGLGVPAAYQQKIFQVFQRAHPNAAKGEGIGLAVVSRLVDRHRGRVWVESQDGVGSAFFVSLPTEGSSVRVNPNSVEFGANVNS